MFNDKSNPSPNQPGFQSVGVKVDGRNDGIITDKAAEWAVPNNNAQSNPTNNPPPFFNTSNSNSNNGHQQHFGFGNGGYGQNEQQHPGSLIGRIVESVVDWAKRNDGSGYTNPEGTFSVKFNQQPGSGIHVKGDNHGSIFNAGRRE
uniref:Uncharacterized protein n=1 Tax=Panagrolaimus sp. PS1159 TaxID=55785 RepID=A0AC35GXD4_9BILA